jgi:hypothetical protein
MKGLTVIDKFCVSEGALSTEFWPSLIHRKDFQRFVLTTCLARWFNSSSGKYSACVIIMNYKLATSIGCLALAGQVLTANAQLLYSDDFNTGTDANWTRWAPPPATATFSFPTVAGGGLGYEMAAAPGTSSFFTTARVGSYVTGLSVSDFSVSADLVNWTGTDEMQMGVMGRVQSPIDNAGAFPGCYALVYINRFSVRGNGTDQLRLYEFAPGAATFLSDGLGNQGQFGVVAGGSAAPHPGGQYELILSGTGNTFRGQIKDLSTGQFLTFNDGNGNLTDYIHGTDASSAYSSGSAGVLTIPNTLVPGVDTTFDNFSVSAIPEPSSIALTMLGLAAFWSVRRQRPVC